MLASRTLNVPTSRRGCSVLSPLRQAPGAVRLGLRSASTCSPKAGRSVSTPAQSTDAPTQVYVINGEDVMMPLGAVQQMPESQQTAIFFAIFAGLGVGTALAATVLSDFFQSQAITGAPVAGGIYALSGVLHLLPQGHSAFCSMYPKQGAWGLWHLPGSASFHINWTGVAEILGGAALIASKVPAVAEALPSLGTTAAWGMFALTLAVTPANIYMATHNAPGPGPKGEVIPPAGHAFRYIMQIFLLGLFWAAANPQ